MGEDLSQGIKVAIILILLISVIAIVFSILAIMKNVTASATQDVQDTLSSISKQKFDDFDQRVVTGSQIVAACKLFATQEIGIYVFTNRGTDFTAYGVNNLQLDSSSYKIEGKELKDVKLGYLVGDYTPEGNTRNDNRSGMNKATSAEYVSATAKFNSYLIKTPSNDIIGIALDEI